jgi:leucyl aminopeptidase
VKNYSGKPVAGAISAAKFLEYFTKSILHGHIWMLPVLLLAMMNLQKQTCHGVWSTFTNQVH